MFSLHHDFPAAKSKGSVSVSTNAQTGVPGSKRAAMWIYYKSLSFKELLSPLFDNFGMRGDPFFRVVIRIAAFILIHQDQLIHIFRRPVEVVE